MRATIPSMDDAAVRLAAVRMLIDLSQSEAAIPPPREFTEALVAGASLATLSGVQEMGETRAIATIVRLAVCGAT